MTGDVNVLFVSVSVVARPTKVSVEVGNVIVPLFVIVEITGDVNVLFVSVSVVARPTKVSEVVGNVRVALPLPTMVTFPPLIPNVRDVVPPLISNPFELFVISRLTDDCFAMCYTNIYKPNLLFVAL